MKILIKGAGDLATGIAARLFRAGHRILMTEIPVPLTVRRTVAFSRAVYEGRAQVEEIEAQLAGTENEAKRILNRGDVAVMIDPDASCREWFRPDVIVDAILAKKNLGTRISDAPFVIGVGPGFTAGRDCSCVVETKRGHFLGRVIWRGGAIPNTGVPGDVGGYTTERLLRASADGIMEPKVQIGDKVEKGQITALTGGMPVFAQMPGIVRGLLQEGAEVRKGLKIGDIDARAHSSYCYTISDKARAVGGAVLEAVSLYEKMAGRYAFVTLAAGLGSRFGGNKLETEIGGIPLYIRALRRMQIFGGFPSYLVSASGHMAEEALDYGVVPIENREPARGISYSLKLGLQRALKDNPDLKGVLFSVCDQPWIEPATIQQIFNTAALHPGSIVCAGCGEQRGNPVLWDRAYFLELAALEGDRGGKQIMEKYGDKVRVVQAGEKELRDIDVKEDLPGAERRNERRGDEEYGSES